MKLTPKGKGQAQRLPDVRPVFEAAYLRLMSESDAKIFESLWRMESALGKTVFSNRIAAEQDRRTAVRRSRDRGSQ